VDLAVIVTSLTPPVDARADLEDPGVRAGRGRTRCAIAAPAGTAPTAPCSRGQSGRRAALGR